MAYSQDSRNPHVRVIITPFQEIKINPLWNIYLPLALACNTFILGFLFPYLEVCGWIIIMSLTLQFIIKDTECLTWPITIFNRDRSQAEKSLQRELRIDDIVQFGNGQYH